MKPACRGTPGGALRPAPPAAPVTGHPGGHSGRPSSCSETGRPRAGHAHRRRAPSSRPALCERAGAPRRALPGPRAWGSQARRARGPGCVGPARGPGGASRAAESRRGRAGLLGEGRRRADSGRGHGVAAAEERPHAASSPPESRGASGAARRRGRGGAEGGAASEEKRPARRPGRACGPSPASSRVARNLRSPRTRGPAARARAPPRIVGRLLTGLPASRRPSGWCRSRRPRDLLPPGPRAPPPGRTRPGPRAPPCPSGVEITRPHVHEVQWTRPTR